ncbi:MAG: DUF4118 domain-containing protein [Pseudomonadota bacterium]
MRELKTVAPPAAGGVPPPAVLPAFGRKRYNGYVVAIMLVAAAFVLRFWLYGGLNNRLPFAFFLPAAMIAAWYGGLGPGMLAAGAGLLLGDYFFLPPHQSLVPLGEAERTSISIYAVTSTLTVFLIGNLQNRVRNLECELAKRAAAPPSSSDSNRDAAQ